MAVGTRFSSCCRCLEVAISVEVTDSGGSTVVSTFHSDVERKHPAYTRRAKNNFDSLSTPPVRRADSHIKMTGVLFLPFGVKNEI